MKDSLISHIAKNCDWHKQVNEKFMPVCEYRLYKLEQMLPSGSGIDSGCKIDVEASSSKRVVINFSFHHMDEHGGYDGWTDHKLIVYPRLWNDFDMRITGRDRNYIKEYLYDLFDSALREIVEL